MQGPVYMGRSFVGKEPDNHEIVMHKIIQMMEKISERMYKIEENNSNIHE